MGYMKINAADVIPMFGFQLTVWFASFLGMWRSLGRRREFCDL